MKKPTISILILVGALVLLPQIASAQQGIQFLDIRKTALFLKNGGEGALLGDSKDTVIKKLGKPFKQDKYYSEMDEKFMDLFIYDESKNTKLYFLDDRLSMYDIDDFRISPLTLGDQQTGCRLNVNDLHAINQSFRQIYGQSAPHDADGYSAVLKTVQGTPCDILFSIGYTAMPDKMMRLARGENVLSVPSANGMIITEIRYALIRIP